MVSNVKHKIKNPCCNRRLTYIGFENILLMQKVFYSSANINTLYHLSLCTTLQAIHLHLTFINYFVFNSKMRYTNVTLMSFASKRDLQSMKY